MHAESGRNVKKILKWCIAVAFTFYFLIQLVLGYEVTLIVALIGGIGGLFLALAASEEAIKSVEALGKKTGISNYVVGVVSSLASNLPEIVVAVIAALKGFTEFAVLVAVITAGFNTLLLGIVIVIGNVRGRSIKVPDELIFIETPVMRSTIAMLALVVCFGILSDLFSQGQVFDIPHEVSFLLVLTYMAYLFFIFKYKRALDVAHEEVSIKDIIIPAIIGFGGIFIAGESLSRVVEISVEIFGLSEAFLALLIGLAGSVPEHIIAVVSATKREVGRIHLGLGNLLAGVMQSYLLLIGIIGTLVSIVLDEFILFELVAGALLIWMMKTSITDDKELSLYEGMMIIITQIFAFMILIETILIAA